MLRDGRGWLLLTVGLGWFITLGSRFVVPAVLPEIRTDFGINNTAAGLAITIIWLTYGGTQFPAGALVDRVGERNLLVGSLLVGGVGLLLFAGSPTFAVLLLAGGAYGIGTGLYGPARSIVLSRTFPDNDGTAFGVVLALGSIGAAALPLVGGVLTGRIGWRLALGGFAPLFLLIAIGVWWAVPPREEEGGRGLSFVERVGGLRAAIGRRVVIVPGLGILFMLFAFQGVTAFFPTYLVLERGFSAALAAAVFAGMFVAGAAFQSILGVFADRWGHRRVLVGAAATSVVPLLALPFVTGLPAIVGVAVLLGVRFAAPPLTNSYIVRVLPADVRGTSWGFVRSVFFVVGSTASVLVGAMADRALFDEAFFVLAAVTAAGTVCYVFMPERDAVV